MPDQLKHSEDQTGKRSNVVWLILVAFAIAGLLMVMLSAVRWATNRKADVDGARSAVQGYSSLL